MDTLCYLKFTEQYSESAAKLSVTVLKNHRAKDSQIFEAPEEERCVQC